MDGEILKAVRDLTPKIRERRARIRLVGVALSSLSDSQHQMKLLDGEQSDKLERLTDGVDHVRSRFGFEAIRLGSSAGLGVKPRLSTPSLSR